MWKKNVKKQKDQWEKKWLTAGFYLFCIFPLANERQCYIVHVMSSLIGWAHTQNDPCLWFVNIEWGNGLVLLSNMPLSLSVLKSTLWYRWLSARVQGWGEYYSGTRLAQNDKHEFTKNIVLEYWFSSTCTHMFSTHPSPMQDCSISSVLALKILQFCTKP